MNTTQFGQGANAGPAPSLWLALVVSLCGTGGIAGLILLAVKVWRTHYRQPKRRRQWLEKFNDSEEV